MGSYGALWRARIEMMRPGNGLMVVFAVWLGAASVTSGSWPQAILDALGGNGVAIWLAAPLAAFLINGFGNVLNDMLDQDIDAQAHPDRPLPSGRISVRDARLWAGALLLLGLIEAALGGTALLLFAGANATLLMLYEWRLKAWPVIGNLVIATLVASAFAFGAVAAGAGPADFGSLWWIMAMVALVNVARELLKDLQDASADTQRHTLAQLLGPTASSWTASSLVGVAVGLNASLVWLRDDWPTLGRAVLALSALAFIVASGMGCRRADHGQRALKVAMLVALVGFALVL